MNGSKMGTVLRLVGIGWYVALCIVGGTFGGLWLDRLLGTSPFLTLLGLAIGIVVGLAGMIRMLMAVVSKSS